MFARSIAIYCASLALAVSSVTSAALAGRDMADACAPYHGATDGPFKPLYHGTGLTKDVYSFATQTGLYAWYQKPQHRVYLKANGVADSSTFFAFYIHPANKAAAPQVSYYLLHGDGDCVAPVAAAAAANGAWVSVSAYVQNN